MHRPDRIEIDRNQTPHFIGKFRVGIIDDRTAEPFVQRGIASGKKTQCFPEFPRGNIQLPGQHGIEGIRQALCSTGGLFLALDSIRDPGNLGTILRIADWFGIDAVFASPDTVDVFNPKVVQSTMGAIFRVRFHYADIPALAGTVLDAGGKVYGTFLDGNDIYSSEIDTGTSAPAVIVIGNESDGISPAVAGLVSDRLYIPPYPAGDPGSESLNAAVATAVTVAEFRRRNYVRRMADARKK